MRANGGRRVPTLLNQRESLAAFADGPQLKKDLGFIAERAADGVAVAINERLLPTRSGHSGRTG
jgi:hypothetical protein